MTYKRKILIVVAATAGALASTAVAFLLRTRREARPDFRVWMRREGLPVLVIFWFFYIFLILGQISQ